MAEICIVCLVFDDNDCFLMYVFVNTICYSTKICTQLLKDEGKSPVLEPAARMGISKNINSLIVKGLNGGIKKESVVSALQELAVSGLKNQTISMFQFYVFKVIHKDVPNIILDVLHIADSATSISDQQNDDSKERIVLGYIVKECEKFLSDKLIKERLEIDTLQEIGILKNRNFYTKFIKVKTKL